MDNNQEINQRLNEVYDEQRRIRDDRSLTEERRAELLKKKSDEVQKLSRQLGTNNTITPESQHRREQAASGLNPMFLSSQPAAQFTNAPRPATTQQPTSTSSTSTQQPKTFQDMYRKR